MDRLHMRSSSMRTYAGQLSGGNQQKVVVAKWLCARCKLTIFDEPTGGIDINGRREALPTEEPSTMSLDTQC